MARALIAVALASLGLICAPGANAAIMPGGMLPDLTTPREVHAAQAAGPSNLSYLGGPVLHSNRTHLIFWAPSNKPTLKFDPGYRSLIESFLSQVAADDRKPTNIYGLTGQYTDAAGPAVYDSKYGGVVIDHDPVPSNGCSEPPTAPPGWTTCMSDAQMRKEILHVISVHHLPTTAQDVYFVVTPNDFGSCDQAGGCALGGSAAGSYCAYHGETATGDIVYAVIPYNYVPPHCLSGVTPRPNGSTADPTLSSLSHEHNEMITDPHPFTDPAWRDQSGDEDGDKCEGVYGPAIGGSSGRQWDESIHGGHYWLQEEWSNDDHSCRPRDENDKISFTGPSHAPIGQSVSFTAHAGDPDGRISGYAWFFGDGNRGRGRHPSHTFSRAGTYPVTLRTTDSAGNYAFFRRSVVVS